MKDKAMILKFTGVNRPVLRHLKNYPEDGLRMSTPSAHGKIVPRGEVGYFMGAVKRVRHCFYNN